MRRGPTETLYTHVRLHIDQYTDHRNRFKFAKLFEKFGNFNQNLAEIRHD